MNKSHNGFTLIELVVVIVILGILAVTAAPKFLNLQDDARHATIKGLVGAINSALVITYGKAAIDGVENDEDATVDNLTLRYGYPKATQESLTQAVDGISDEQWNFEELASDNGSAILIFPQNITLAEGYVSDETCIAIYRDASVSQAAKAYVAGSDCDGLSFEEIP